MGRKVDVQTKWKLGWALIVNGNAEAVASTKSSRGCRINGADVEYQEEGERGWIGRVGRVAVGGFRAGVGWNHPPTGWVVRTLGRSLYSLIRTFVRGGGGSEGVSFTANTYSDGRRWSDPIPARDGCVTDKSNKNDCSSATVADDFFQLNFGHPNFFLGMKNFSSAPRVNAIEKIWRLDTYVMCMWRAYDSFKYGDYEKRYQIQKKNVHNTKSSPTIA